MLPVISWTLPLIAAFLLAQGAPQALPDYAVVDVDTIYRLAVDSAEYPEEDYVYLLDDGVLVFEADGRGRASYHQVVQILTQDAAEQWGERSYSFLKDRERLVIDWIRVVTPDGQVVSEGARHEQESIAPTAHDYPVFTDRIVRRLSIGGLAPGTLLDIRYTRETLEPAMPGHFASSWRVNPATPTLRSRLVLDVPVTLEPHIREFNLDFACRTFERDGRQVHVWATSDVTPPDPELFTKWLDDGSMYIAISGDIDWEDVSGWYAGLARDCYQLTPEIEAELSEVVADARTLDDSLRAVHRWVTQDFRYVSLALDIGGYQPRTPAEVRETMSGDCKDKATFFIALARHMGVEAYPVLVSRGATADSMLPSTDEFDHVIAAVSRADAYLFLDLTAEYVPYGSVPPSLQGGFALIVHPDGGAERVTIGSDPPESHRSEFLIRGELTADGVFTGKYTETHSGATGYALRTFVDGLGRMTDREKERLIRHIANSVFAGAEGDSFEVFDASDPAAKPRLSLWIHAPQATSRAGQSHILTLPIPNLAAPALVAQLEAELPRQYPIDVPQVVGPSVRSWTVEITLPPTWQADLPPDIREAGRFGSYSAEYSQEGRTLRAKRELAGRRGSEPPEVIDELIAWLRAIFEDNVQYLLLAPPDAEK